MKIKQKSYIEIEMSIEEYKFLGYIFCCIKNRSVMDTETQKKAAKIYEDLISPEDLKESD